MQQEFATAFCAFTCVFAFSCCAYCTWIVHLNSRQCHSDRYKITMEPEMTEQHARSISYNLEDFATQAFQRYKRSTDNKKRHRVKKSKTRAAHYITDVLAHYQDLPGYHHSTISGTCKNIVALDGKLCRDESFTPNGNQLNIFTEASWVNSKKSPFKQLKSGIFEARYSGIYLVYGQLLALDDGDSRNINLIQSRKNKEIQRIMCFESFKLNDNSLRFKTCAITALFDVKRKDRFVIQNTSSSPKLSLREGANFIGALLLK